MMYLSFEKFIPLTYGSGLQMQARKHSKSLSPGPKHNAPHCRRYRFEFRTALNGGNRQRESAQFPATPERALAPAAVAPCPNGGVVGAGAAVTSSETTRQRHVQISEDDEKRREGLVAKWEGKVSSDYKIVVSARSMV